MFILLKLDIIKIGGGYTSEQANKPNKLYRYWPVTHGDKGLGLPAVPFQARGFFESRNAVNVVGPRCAEFRHKARMALAV
jgi:hypothetical protein